jgi:hypothetical protein
MFNKNAIQHILSGAVLQPTARGAFIARGFHHQPVTVILIPTKHISPPFNLTKSIPQNSIFLLNKRLRARCTECE